MCQDAQEQDNALALVGLSIGVVCVGHLDSCVAVSATPVGRPVKDKSGIPIRHIRTIVNTQTHHGNHHAGLGSWVASWQHSRLYSE